MNGSTVFVVQVYHNKNIEKHIDQLGEYVVHPMRVDAVVSGFGVVTYFFW